MSYNDQHDQARFHRQGEQLLSILQQALDQLQSLPPDPRLVAYAAFLHGQVYGLATALHLLFPGKGNLGEKAALSLRPVLTEHHCDCGGK
ncbi:hypothetical protein GFC01_16415 [Desulfofundulus thermobenzoicus]|uniref:Uncharacterized protein n=1 Tax=Desulfofundulus thermobenzoicus TaxID=29376 RepID=A0A6N7IUQ2_9FIRM|nr:hypothetical protein [Desulfofundulus thermobenzoicus]MQL53810.1 hypothetical protein [Desulfofundulus thermobenzoicus]